MPTIGSNKSAGLVRGLGLWAATAVVIGAMIGQAIFLVTSQIARDVGSEIGGLAVWLAGGVIVLLGAFCYAELGAAMPGGEYVYLSRGLGPVWGFLYGWTSALIMRPGSAATIAAGLLRFTGFLLPSAATPIFAWHFTLPFQPYQFTFTASQPLAAAVVAAVTAINYFGVRTAGRIQIVLSGLKVAAVVTVVVLGLALGRVSGIHPGSMADPLAYGTAGAFLTALVPVMAAYNGFQQLGWVGGEIVNPQKNIPRAAILGVLSVAGLYVLINLAYFRVLTFSQVA
jgi:basic amino acid/polyamine antiporter, APA family